MTRGIYPYAKRALDILGALLLAFVLLPMTICTTAAVRVFMGPPVFFRQARPGRGQKPFILVKFRTMRMALDTSGSPLPDVDRLTPFGAFLRRASLDELPTLWNVLKGDMSFVGPRPLLERYLPYYTNTEKLRFSVRPGITGWAQVHGRNTTSWNERLEQDAWYAQNMSLHLDLRILLRTPRLVLQGTGVVVDARSVMQNLDEERANRPRTAFR